MMKPSADGFFACGGLGTRFLEGSNSSATKVLNLNDNEGVKSPFDA